jgi:hypothetical protein
MPTAACIYAHADALWQPDQLLQLTRLHKLQHLSLIYTSAEKARAAAPTWRQLTCLTSLLITDEVAQLSLHEGQELLAAVGAAGSLVELELRGGGLLLDDDSGVCMHLTGRQSQILT